MKDFQFNLGDELRDGITGFVGVVTNRVIYASGCVKYGLVGRDIPDGKSPQPIYFDDHRLKRTENSAKNDVVNGDWFEFELLDVVEDKLSGFKGVVAALEDFGTSVDTVIDYAIEPIAFGEDGKLGDWLWVVGDRLQAVIGEECDVPEGDAGGPMPLPSH